MLTNHNESELATELAERGLTHREIIAIGAGLGLASSSLSAVLAMTAQEARAQESIFDKNAGVEDPRPETAVPEPTEEITLAVSHAWVLLVGIILITIVHFTIGKFWVYYEGEAARMGHRILGF
jgi:hypothetical protein